VTGGLPIHRALRQKMSVEEILREINRAADLPLEKAVTLPAEAYSNDAFFDWEVENILRKDWFCVGHISQLPKPGDFVNIDLFGEPVIVIHGKDGVVRTLSRICPHRAMDIMPPGFGQNGHGPAVLRDGSSSCGHTRILMCPYHAWTFELDGALKGSPEMQQAEDFCRTDVSLKQFRTESWKGFVFVNFDGNAEPLTELFAGMTEATADWDFEDMEVVEDVLWDCDCNWKVYIENYSECYHHIGAHAKTLQPLMPAKECWTEEENPVYVQGHLPLKQPVLDVLAEAIREGREFPLIEGTGHQKQSEWQLIMALPSLMLFPGPNQIGWWRIEPLTTDKCRVHTIIMVPKSYRDLPQFELCRENAKKVVMDFHNEDMDVCSAVQRGLYGAGFQRGRMSHLEMPVWLIHRYLAARSRGTRPATDRPAAASQLGRIGPIPV